MFWTNRWEHPHYATQPPLPQKKPKPGKDLKIHLENSLD